MNSNRIWTAGGVLAIVAILGGAAGLGVQPHLAAAATADASRIAADTQNDTTTIEIARLTRLAAKQSTLEAESTDLQNLVPPSLRVNSLSRMLRNTAALDGVKVVAFTPSGPTSYAPVTTDGSVVSTASVAAANPKSSATPETAAPAAPADPKSPWFGATDAAVTADNFTVVPLTVTVTGTETAVLAFASDAQQQKRLFAVTSVSSDLDKDTGLFTGVVSGYVYTLDK